jgi:tripartite-type tricarboxylate transporter receptor subunit TctC
MKTLRALAAACGVALVAATATAQTYPTRPVTLVVPFPPGGQMDLTGRLLADKLQARLGQPVVVENRAGGGGAVGAQSVANANADGYTLLLSNQGPHVVREILYPETPYRTSRDFAAVSTVVSAPLFLVAGRDSPVKSVADLTRQGKESTKGRNFASAGIGSQSHIAGEGLNMAAGTGFLHVPYNGAAKQVAALLSGEVEVAFLAAGDALPRMKDGSVRALAVASEKRFSLAPGVPTLGEAGIKGQNFDVWYGVLAPAATPPQVIERLNRDVSAVVSEPAFAQRLQQMGVNAESSSPAEMMARFRRDHELYQSVIKRAGIKAE